MKSNVNEECLKRKRLKDLDVIVLDNSIRESTVGQLRGHTLENKWKIFDEVVRIKTLNRSSMRNRGMAFNPLFIIPDFYFHFPNELSYGYLRFGGNGKIPLGR